MLSSRRVAGAASLLTVLVVACAADSGTPASIESPTVKPVPVTPSPSAVADASAPSEQGARGSGDADASMANDASDASDATPDGAAPIDAGAGDGGMDPGYVAFDINHILETGQSNAVANNASPILSTTQPYANIMFDVGVMTGAQCDGEGCKSVEHPTRFVPLVEGDSFIANTPVETMSAGLANAIAKAGRERLGKHDVLTSLHGRSGRTYWCLRKTGCAWQPEYMNPTPFEEGMGQVRAALALARAQGASYVVRAVTSIHGESDHNAYVANAPEFPLDGTDGTPGKIKDYTDALVEWQNDYQTGVRAITGQTQPVPLFISQLSGWNSTVAASPIATMQLAAHVRAPGKVVLVTPGYPFLFQSDCLHYTAASQRRLGEYFAKAYRRVVFDGKAWEPVRPLRITRAGASITVQFAVPKPPLVLDTTLVAAVANYGFTFDDGSGAPPAITQVAVTAADTVTITLAAPPTGATPLLRYAQNQVAGTCVGAVSGARGNLRDSDDTPTAYAGDPAFAAAPYASEPQYSAPLYDWAVQFEAPVP